MKQTREYPVSLFGCIKRLSLSFVIFNEIIPTERAQNSSDKLNKLEEESKKRR